MSYTPKSKMLRAPRLVRDPAFPNLVLAYRRARSLMVLGGRAVAAALMALLLVGSADTPPPPEDPPAVPDLGPVDHRASACPDAPARHRVGRPERYPDSAFLVTLRSSVPARKDREIRLRPGRLLHLEVEIRNAGTETLGFAPSDLEMMRQVDVRAAGIGWELTQTPVGPLAAGHRLEPGASIRYCLAFDPGLEPLDAAPPSQGGERYFLLSWFAGPHQGLGASGGYLATGVTLTVRYAEHPGPVRREATSWGGVIALDLEEGANVLDIARATGTRVGTGVPLHEGQGTPRPLPRPAGQQGEGVQALPDVLVADAYVQAPPQVTVAEAAERLLARDDVRAAHPLMYGDPGTEGCSEHAPCNPGQSCCYVCGIAGCPNICYDGDCPRNVP